MRNERNSVLWRTTWLCLAIVVAAASRGVAGAHRAPAAQATPGIEYRVLATTKTSTMEKELNQGAEAGFRFDAVMGGNTAVGGSEVVAIMSKAGETKGRYAYRLLATSRTSTMEKELREAADLGFEYRAQTVFSSTFGGEEVVCILERDKDAAPHHSDYRLLATSRTSTMQKELRDVGAAGYSVMGMTVAPTALGGKELVVILRRMTAQ
jgi:hypothetical protein